MISESCLPETVRVAPHIVLSCPFQNVAGCILQPGVWTTSLLRSSHDFSVPWAECLSPCYSFPHLRLWLKLCSKCCCTDFWGGVSGLQQRPDSRLIFTHPYNLEFVLCCLFSEINFPYSKCQGGTSGQKEHQLLLSSGCTAFRPRLCGDLIQKTLQAQVHCAGKPNKSTQVWINTLGSCYSRKEGGRLDQAYWREIAILVATFSLV